MDAEPEPRTAVLLALAGPHVPPALITWLMEGFDALEQTDFGEREPVGVGAPVPR